MLEVPSVSTIHAVLRRHDRLLHPAQAYDRFEQPRPNALWQMDFKGHVPLGDGSRLHPLAIRPTQTEGCYQVCFGSVVIQNIDLKNGPDQGTKL